jgi:hypothetical protein
MNKVVMIECDDYMNQHDLDVLDRRINMYCVPIRMLQTP